MPPYPENGIYLVGKKQIDPGVLVDPFTIVTYMCDSGFSLFKYSSIYCREDGTWNDHLQCLSEFLAFIRIIEINN